MIRHRHNRGLSLIELAVTTVASTLLIGAAVLVVSISRSSAESSVRLQTVDTRADRALWPIVREARRGSMATLQKRDATTLSDGETDTGFSFLPVTGWDGGLVTGPRVTYWLDRDVGASTGTLMRSEVGAADRQIATNVTEFTVARAEQRLVLAVTVRSGPDDDRERLTTAGVEISPRNP